MIVITAPTSKIGRQVLERVLESGEDIRVITRDPLRIPEAVRERVEVIQGSHADREVVHQAFEGADAVFWLVPADKQAVSVYDAYVRFSIRCRCDRPSSHRSRRGDFRARARSAALCGPYLGIAGDGGVLKERATAEALPCQTDPFPQNPQTFGHRFMSGIDN